MPWTARGRPPPVTRSACFHSAPGQSSPGLARRLIHARNTLPRSIASRPGGPIFPRRRLLESVACSYPFVFLFILHAPLSEVRTGDERTWAECDTPLWLFSVLFRAYN